MYEEMSEQEYWKSADRKIAALTLKPEHIEKVMAWRSMNDRNVLRLWEIYDDILLLRIQTEQQVAEVDSYRYATRKHKYRDLTNVQESSIEYKWQHEMFRMHPAPPSLPYWQDYIARAKSEKNTDWFLSFLHYYEPTVNARVQSFAERYAMTAYFLDLKLAYVYELWYAFLFYDISSDVPFLTYCSRDISDALQDEARKLGNGFTAGNATHYYKLRKTAYLYSERGEKSESEVTDEICKALKVKEKTARKLIEEVEARRRFVDFYHAKDPDADDDCSGEDVTVDFSDIPDRIVPAMPEGDKIDSALAALTKRELDLIEGRIGFCSDCFHNKSRKSYDELADMYQFTTEEGAEKAYMTAFENLLARLVERDFCHALTLDKVGNETKNGRTISVTYAYQPDFEGEPGEILFDLTHDAGNSFIVNRTAEMDITGVYAEQAAKLVAKMQGEEERLIAEAEEANTEDINIREVYVKHKSTGIRLSAIKNVTPKNAVSNFPKCVAFRTQTKKDGRVNISYYPDCMRIPKKNEVVISSGMITARLTNCAWKYINDNPDAQDYADEVIRRVSGCLDNDVALPKV
ncbi:MAG: hypothetical protein GX851_03820, partial [Clostridiales bacterium]|nr:hypothetical protein [Clostridiales bacterium]